MATRITTISLDEKTAKIAKTLPNLSHFVRECLYRHAANMNVQECSREKWEESDCCNPFVQPVCFACWPNGAPPKRAVRQYRQDNLSLGWLQEQAKFHNREIFDVSGINSSRTKPERKKSTKRGGLFAWMRGK